MAFLKVKNRAISTLASGVSDVATEWTVATGEGALFPSSGDFHVTCEDEIVKCTARSDDVLTVVRAQEGTAAAAHDADKAVQLRITAGIIDEIQMVLDGGIDKTHLSQDFGASGTRLRNIVMASISGEALRIANCSGSCFKGVIDDNAGAHGGQGLDATHVPYDGESEEDMFNGLSAYDGSDFWGQIILHNTTKSESCKIVSVDRTNDVITVTADSPDDVSKWDDDDVITTESQTNEGSGAVEYFDIDISDNVGTGVAGVVLMVVFQNNTASANANNMLALHPYETYGQGKRQWCKCAVANECTNIFPIVPVTSQKITLTVYTSGVDDFYVILSVVGKVEFADT